MVIDLDKMTDKVKKEIYKAMWVDGFESDMLDGRIDRTYSTKYKKKSVNSYSFVSKGCNAKTLSEIFDIENEALFCDKYHMAVSGAGNEGTKILTLLSSSLCALLHFYNVTEKNPLILELTTKNGKVKRTVEFTQSVFEYKSPVINKPSNMDVVLIGEDKKDNKKIVFFLESKFSEYYTGITNSRDKISIEYLNNEYSKELYQESVLEQMGLKIADKTGKNFSLKNIEKEKPFYIEGIKQMISHYTGIRNVLSGNRCSDWDTDERQHIVDDALKGDALKGDAVAILGEIIFDERIGKLKNCKEIYSSKYSALSKQMSNLIGEGVNLEVLDTELGYSMFRDYNETHHKIEPNIRTFYGYT